MELWILKYFPYHGGKTIIVLVIINSSSTRKELTVESRTDGSPNWKTRNDGDTFGFF